MTAFNKLLAAACAGALLLALAQGQALELAVHTGLHDLRQALLTGGGGLLYAIAVSGLSRRP